MRIRKLKENVVCKRKTIRYILFYLYKKGISYQAEIAKGVGVESGNFQYSWKDLRKSELIEDIPKSKRKAQIQKVKLTPKGIKITKLLLEIDTLLK